MVERFWDFFLGKRQLEGWQLLIKDLLAKEHLLLFEFASYPSSPKQTFCPKREVSVNVSLGEG